MIWLNFKRWNSSGGKFFVCQRIWRDGYKWTPFIKVRKRYSSWLGHWKS